MTRLLTAVAAAALFAASAISQDPLLLEEDASRRPYPGAKDQREELLKREYEQSLKDAERLVELSKELKADLEKNTRHVVSLSSIRKTEEIERLAKRIRSRMVR